MYKKGTLVKHRRSGGLFEITRGVYTARFMEQQDHDMVADGWGHMAGIYTGAIDLVAMDGPSIGQTFKKQRVKNFMEVRDS